MKLAIIGAGAWGTALAMAFAPRHGVTLLARDAAQVRRIRDTRENSIYLPGRHLAPEIKVESGYADLSQSDLILIATPLSGLRATLNLLLQEAPRQPFLWACKGLEAGTGALPNQVVAETHAVAASGALSGPSFADEVARGLPAAVTIASTDAEFAQRSAEALNGPRLRIYASEDLVGVEVAGALKNVVAIAAGICDGMGLGLNARAALITRGLAEITRFGMALGAKRETFMGLAGMGDVILTCTGDLSRNRRVGLALAGGQSPAQITAGLGHVAEGVLTAAEVVRRATGMNLDMPVCAAVCAVLDGRLKPADTVNLLMARDAKFE